MCVITYKPSEAKIPGWMIRQQWWTNPDGAGLAYYLDDGKTIQVEKGFMHVDALIARLDDLEDEEVVYHCRIATSGHINQKQTHPFAIRNSVKESKGRSLDFKTKACLFHNGVIGGFGTEDVSDTLHFTSKVLSSVRRDERVELLDCLSDRFVLMQEGQLWFVGSWSEVKEKGLEGVRCSNLYWQYGGKGRVKRNWRAWDYDDGGYYDGSYATRSYASDTASDGAVVVDSKGNVAPNDSNTWITCPECNGTGGAQYDCELCEGYGLIDSNSVGGTLIAAKYKLD